MSTTATSVPGSSHTEPAEVKQSDAVKEATTLKEHGFPVNTPDGQILATKNAVTVDADGNEVKKDDQPPVTETKIVLEGENGTLEATDDPHIHQAEGTADAEAKKAEKAASDEPKAKASKSE